MLFVFMQSRKLEHCGSSSKGIITGNNEKFLRLWHEVFINNVNFSCEKSEEASQSELKWYPCRKGGIARKWYGNNEYIINWQYNGYEVIACAKGNQRNCQDYADDFKFRKLISWTSISSGKLTFRVGKNDLCESAGMSYFSEEKNISNIAAFLNSIVAYELLLVLSPTMNYTAGAINSLPTVESIFENKIIEYLANDSTEISRIDWDSYETSWDFKKHPLI